jgi:ribonuclease inhibitor
MKIEFDGEAILSEGDFHDALAEALDLTGYYGGNLSALWDVLSTDVERPVRLVWENSAVSQAAMGSGFDRLVDVLRRVEKQDTEWNLPNRFELVLK